MHNLNIYQYIVSLKRSIKPLELYDSNLKVWIVSTLGSLKVTTDISSYKKKKKQESMNELCWWPFPYLNPDW